MSQKSKLFKKIKDENKNTQNFNKLKMEMQNNFISEYENNQ